MKDMKCLDEFLAINSVNIDIVYKNGRKSTEIKKAHNGVQNLEKLI